MLAPDGRRVVAACIDGAPVAALALAVWWAGAGWVSAWAPPEAPDQWPEHMLAQVAQGLDGWLTVLTPLLTPLLLWACWQGAWQALWAGQTPGKRLLNLYVADAHGDPPSLGQVAARAAASVASGALLGWGFWLGLVSERRLTLHDALSGTQVLWRGPKAARLIDAARRA